jgi:hypothetical protein
MEPPKEQESVVHDIDDLAKAIHTIGDHLVALHRRLERLEATQSEWTTHGWEAPPGADHSSGKAT